jgi:mRNA-degrading endonuclease RelE of RelBE toxin-antitoxin system
LSNACLIDSRRSPTFNRQLKELAKRYRHIETDLANAYAEIIKDRLAACNACQVPGFEQVWKYRCDSSDMKRGQSGGFRLMTVWSEPESTLYPFCVYTHVDYPVQPPTKDVRKWLKEILRIPETPERAMAVVAVECRVCGVGLSLDETDAFGDLCAKHRTASMFDM